MPYLIKILPCCTLFQKKWVFRYEKVGFLKFFSDKAKRSCEKAEFNLQKAEFINNINSIKINKNKQNYDWLQKNVA